MMMSIRAGKTQGHESPEALPLEVPEAALHSRGFAVKTTAALGVSAHQLMDADLCRLAAAALAQPNGTIARSAR
jgi:hypothetical protein